MMVIGRRSWFGVMVFTLRDIAWRLLARRVLPDRLISGSVT
jgi:hypothetical protein